MGHSSQFLQEYAWHKGGWSIQQEFHFKKISDRFNDQSVNIRGAYLNVGWFPSAQFDNWPVPLELAARVALVNPYSRVELHQNKEFTLAANWFFNGHRNKLTTDISRLQIDDPQGQSSDWRFRLQWDGSL